jgi:signal peptidase I
MKKIKIIGIFLVSVIVMAVGMRLAGYRVNRYIEGKHSMVPTIQSGDVCLCYFHGNNATEDIKPGMIVLFSHRDYPYFLTKRIIAAEDDLVEVKGEKTLVNGSPIDEPYAFFEIPGAGSGDVNSVLVPENKLFVMGDNRSRSLDSRYSEFGLVDIDQIKGKPLIILWSRDKRRIGKRLN